MDNSKSFWKQVKRVLKEFKRTIVYIHKKTKYLYIFLFFDMIWCLIRYGITYNEYRIFEFYDIDCSKRKTFVSQRKYNKLNRKLVDKDIINVIKDKKLFLRRFKDYIKSDIYNINDMSFKEFEDFALNSKVLIARSENKSLLTSFKKYNVSSYRSPAFVLEDIKEKKQYLVEKCVSQNKLLNEIDDLVLINVVSVTYNKNVDAVSSTIKFVKDGQIISGFVDVQTGKIVGHFKDYNGTDYGELFEGFEIPQYDEIMDMVLALALELEEIMQVEWSFMVSSRGNLNLMDASVWND